MRSDRHPRARGRTKLAPGAEVFAAAAQAVAAVAFSGQNADQALAELSSAADVSAVRAVTLGTIRWYLRLEPAVRALIDRPARSLAPPLRALLVVAAHQIEYSRGAPEQSVNLAVDASRALGLSRASGFANAVLRRFVRERATLLARVDADRAARTAHPAWLVESVDHEWPQHADRLLAANNAHPPLVLRVDLTRQHVGEFIARLTDAGLAARAMDWLPGAVRLETPVPVASIPGFTEGLASVQDAGAQLAAPFLAVEPGMRVLDACAAPGGKTGHLLELSPGIELVALDIDPARLARVRENLLRLRREALLVAADLRDTRQWWDGRAFERILVDAPCSGSGVIRRHPDIKLLRRASDVAAMSEMQLELLAAAFEVLARGGRMLYGTCSILAAENDAVLQRFLRAEPSARIRPLAAPLPPGALETRYGVQLLPGAQADTDGFHYACIEKATTGT